MRKLIKSKERVKEHGEVFTPERIVTKMLDMLEENNPDCFLPEKTFLEPSCGDGNFLVEILRRKLAHCHNDDDIRTAVQSIYGVDILEDNVQESRHRMQEILHFDCTDILERNIVCGNFLKPETVWFLDDMLDGHL